MNKEVVSRLKIECEKNPELKAAFKRITKKALTAEKSMSEAKKLAKDAPDFPNILGVLTAVAQEKFDNAFRGFIKHCKRRGVFKDEHNDLNFDDFCAV